MKVKIWGARGSHPKPMTKERFQEKVKSIVQRIRPIDIASNEHRERFLASLPDWLWGIPGGNTPCIEVRTKDDQCLIFDAGTGIIPLSRQLFKEEYPSSVFHLFFSHFHYDHIQGLPFFSQAYLPETELHFYNPEEDLASILRNHMQHPFFPITMEERMTQRQHFHILETNSTKRNFLRFATTEVHWKAITHPGNSYAYKIVEDGKSLIIATDYELSGVDFEKTEDDFFEGSDLLILDTMYTLGEAIEKFNWGHSSFSMGVDFAHAWKTKRLLLFHHEPLYDDKRLYTNLRTARWYAERQDYTDLHIDIAKEGMEIML